MTTTAQAAVHADRHHYSRKKPIQLRGFKEWEPLFPTPEVLKLWNRCPHPSEDSLPAVHGDHAASCFHVSRPRTRLTIAPLRTLGHPSPTHAGHSHSWLFKKHTLLNKAARCRKPPLYHPNTFLVKNAGRRRGSSSVLDTGTTLHGPRDHGHHPATSFCVTVQSVLVQNRPLLELRHFILSGCALCPLLSERPQPGSWGREPPGPKPWAWQSTCHTTATARCYAGRQGTETNLPTRLLLTRGDQVTVTCQYSISLLKKIQQVGWDKLQFKWPLRAY